MQASIYRFEGQMLTIDTTSDAGCLRCLWPEAPVQGLVGDCAEVGVLGSLPAIFGGLQANQAIQHILGLGGNKDLLLFDLLTMESRKISRHRSPDCAVCGDNPSIIHLQESEATECEFKASIHDTRGDLLEKFILIDVREDNERHFHPLPEAESRPLSSFDIGAFHHPRETSLLMICAKGFRSAKVAERLRKAGWMNVFSLAGGIEQLPKHLNVRVG
jgi:adenylyltransferase/sulfurtransferase